MDKTSIESSPKKLLYEVSIIRPIVIFLLVFMHSFTKIAAGGGYTNDYQLDSAYQWLCWLISGFRIETIALVAGYVFAYQCLDLKRSYRFLPFAWKKFKRLIIPMLVFGLIYYFCFFYHSATFGVKDFVIKLLSGCGHLWFLPMLFWCFLAIWAIDHFKLSSWLTLLILAGVTLLPPPYDLPFGFSKLPHFVFYVYAGYFLWTKRSWLLEKCLKKSIVISLWVIYVALVIVRNAYMPETHGPMSLIEKTVMVTIPRFVDLLMSCCGVMALYLSVCMVTTREGYRPKQWIINASDNCYGVYVYHQFILVALYFFTPLVSLLHPLLTPWVGFVIVLSGSLLLTKVSLKTNVGKFLIG